MEELERWISETHDIPAEVRTALRDVFLDARNGVGEGTPIDWELYERYERIAEALS